jgi:hypothetical protein
MFIWIIFLDVIEFKSPFALKIAGGRYYHGSFSALLGVCVLR